ncbi:hypothetical protein Pmani_005585 [Petrolisthes manimaculis]|uniref:Uncharacterized protein n=1 Tax=Petrolisthes manimaculis TaxID=1843537 RepID=A0AAE1QBE1_9EUCA|nr:hypothetical protein Pmani_005585 [Petrolisthes manimaculis]
MSSMERQGGRGKYGEGDGSGHAPFLTPVVASMSTTTHTSPCLTYQSTLTFIPSTTCTARYTSSSSPGEIVPGSSSERASGSVVSVKERKISRQIYSPQFVTGSGRRRKSLSSSSWRFVSPQDAASPSHTLLPKCLWPRNEGLKVVPNSCTRDEESQKSSPLQDDINAGRTVSKPSGGSSRVRRLSLSFMLSKFASSEEDSPPPARGLRKGTDGEPFSFPTSPIRGNDTSGYFKRRATEPAVTRATCTTTADSVPQRVGVSASKRGASNSSSCELMSLSTVPQPRHDNTSQCITRTMASSSPNAPKMQRKNVERLHQFTDQPGLYQSGDGGQIIESTTIPRRKMRKIEQLSRIYIDQVPGKCESDGGRQSIESTTTPSRKMQKIEQLSHKYTDRPPRKNMSGGGWQSTERTTIPSSRKIPIRYQSDSGGGRHSTETTTTTTSNFSKRHKKSLVLVTTREASPGLLSPGLVSRVMRDNNTHTSTVEDSTSSSSSSGSEAEEELPVPPTPPLFNGRALTNGISHRPQEEELLIHREPQTKEEKWTSQKEQITEEVYVNEAHDDDKGFSKENFDSLIDSYNKKPEEVRPTSPLSDQENLAGVNVKQLAVSYLSVAQKDKGQANNHRCDIQSEIKTDLNSSVNISNLVDTYTSPPRAATPSKPDDLTPVSFRSLKSAYEASASGASGAVSRHSSSGSSSPAGGSPAPKEELNISLHQLREEYCRSVQDGYSRSHTPSRPTPDTGISIRQLTRSMNDLRTLGRDSGHPLMEGDRQALASVNVKALTRSFSDLTRLSEPLVSPRSPSPRQQTPAFSVSVKKLRASYNDLPHTTSPEPANHTGASHAMVTTGTENPSEASCVAEEKGSTIICKMSLVEGGETEKQTVMGCDLSQTPTRSDIRGNRGGSRKRSTGKGKGKVGVRG